MEEKQVNNENEEFPLYTEKIVVNPKKKYFVGNIMCSNIWNFGKFCYGYRISYD